MSVATLAAEVTTRLGTARLVELTNFDAPTAITVNTARRDAAVTDAAARVRARLGLVEPADAASDEHASYVELAVKGARYFLLWYKEPEGNETKNALQEFSDAMDGWRARQAIALVTDSPVDVSEEDVRPRRPRFAPSHFTAHRIGSGKADADTDEDTDG